MIADGIEATVQPFLSSTTTPASSRVVDVEEVEPGVYLVRVVTELQRVRLGQTIQVGNSVFLTKKEG